jgi:hypothetical protein
MIAGINSAQSIYVSFGGIDAHKLSKGHVIITSMVIKTYKQLSMTLTALTIQ